MTRGAYVLWRSSASPQESCAAAAVHGHPGPGQVGFLKLPGRCRQQADRYVHGTAGLPERGRRRHIIAPMLDNSPPLRFKKDTNPNVVTAL